MLRRFSMRSGVATVRSRVATVRSGVATVAARPAAVLTLAAVAPAVVALAVVAPAVVTLAIFPAGAVAAPGIAATDVPGHLLPPTYTVPFVDGADHDPAFPELATLLGESAGARPASGEEIRRACEAIAAATPRVRLVTHGASHEGRPLIHAVVSSADNLGRLDELQARHAALAGAGDDWRRADVDALARELPVVVWIGAAVHGGETSGADAALALLHHLAADRGARTRRVLDETILLIDPLQNPDGRARFMVQMTQWEGRIPTTDAQSRQHRRDWPSARGNHYFLDLNRDWFALSQPETRARTAVLLEWQPQVTFDLHEMGAFDTYLFSPPRQPYNPYLPEMTHRWWDRFAQAQARAFGAHGWSCYTGDWNEEFNPNRGASWSLFTGAVALLGEQSTTKGGSVRRPDGSVLTYREAVHHQFTAALELLVSVAEGREELLRDYGASRRALAGVGSGRDVVRRYVFSAAEKPGLARRLAATLAAQGIEVRTSTEAFDEPDARNYWGERRGDQAFPAGSFIVPLEQAEGRLARAILDFDPPLGNDFLSRERRRHELAESSLLYESSAWSLAMAYGVNVYADPNRWREQTVPLAETTAPPGGVERPAATFGFLLGAGESGAARALAALVVTGTRCWAVREAFTVEGRLYGPGTVLVQRGANDTALIDRLDAIAARTGAHFRGIDHALTTSGQDLGSRSVRPLRRPRVALLSGAPFYQTTFGAVWHWLDQELGLPCALLRLSHFSTTDLEPYNVLIAPDAAPGRGPDLVTTLGEEGRAALAGWVRRGGTLITLGEGSWLLFGGEEPMSKVRARRQVLGELGDYAVETRDRRRAAALTVDETALRAGAEDAIRPPGGGADSVAAGSTSKMEDKALRRYSPRGVILRADLDSEHWLTAGAGTRLPVLVRTDLALMSKLPVETVGQFATTADVRVAGLLWPEARRRWADTTYLGRERIGAGQVIAFLGNPVYRTYFHGTGRLLSNAILLGPGMGTAARPE